MTLHDQQIQPPSVAFPLVYQTAFALMEQGFCLLEKVNSDTHQPPDFRYLLVNPTFHKHTGLQDVVSKTIREVVPEAQQSILAIYEQVAATGQSRQFEAYVAPLDLWIQANVFRISPQPTQLAVLFTNITQRKLAQEALHRSAQRDAFLVKLTDALRPLAEPIAIQQAALSLVGEYLNLDRALYNEIDPDVTAYTTLTNYVREGFPAYVGRFAMGPFTKTVKSLQRGKTLVIDDVEKEEQFSQAERDYCISINVRSFVTVPLIKEGHWVVNLVVHYSKARQWTPDEVSILEETAERTWAAVERAKAEAALRASERRQAFLLRFGDTLRPLTDEPTILRTAARLLGEHLGVERCFFGELHHDQDLALMHPDYARGDLPSLAGPFRISDLRENVDALSSGRAFAIPDVAASALLSDHSRAGYLALGFAAFFSVPLLTHGRLDLNLSVVAGRPRDWDAAEIELAQEVAARTWTIVGRVRAEKALRESEAKYRTLFESLDEGFCIFDLQFDAESNAVDWIYREANPAFEGQTGYVNAVGKRISELQPDLERSWFERFAEVARTGEPVRFVQYTEAMGRWYDVYAFRVGEAGENRVALLFTDISERRRTEDALRESQKRFESIANLVPDLLWESRPVGSTNWYNQRWLDYTGQSFEEAIGWGWTDGIHPEDREASARHYDQAVTAGTSLRQEHRIRRHDGVYRWFVVSAAPLKDRRGQVVAMYGAATDIHEIKRLEMTLLEADRRKDEFLAMLAHELRNPMSTLRSGLQILTITDGKDQTSRETIAMMNRQTDQLVRMVDDLLDVSRISQGKIELIKSRLNLVELVSQAAQAAQVFYQEQGRRLSVELPTAPIYVEGDEARLTQVVTNLLTNGARYTEENGQVWLSLAQQDGPTLGGPSGGPQAVLQVRDNGIGLTAEQQVAIFELFVQIDNSLARSKGGLGLGLTLVKRLVELHRGQVDVQSEGLGQGSTFRVHIPTLTPPPQPSLSPANDQPDEIPTQRILVVDDNADAALSLSMLLRLKGYEVHTRHSGQAGLDAVEELRPAAILLDIGMPGLDGYETCRLLREQPWGGAVVVIALSGYGQQEDRQRTQAAGFDGHLVKPVDLGALLALLASVLPTP